MSNYFTNWRYRRSWMLVQIICQRRLISDYRIQWSTDRSNWTDVAHPVSTQRSITVSDLVPGTRYWFRVAAVNVVGQGRFGPAR